MKKVHTDTPKAFVDEIMKPKVYAVTYIKPYSAIAIMLHKESAQAQCTDDQIYM